jgi:hypothetical protein
MSRKFALYEQKYPANAAAFRIIETYETSDGYRSRICDGQFLTEEQAMHEITEREHRYKGEINIVRAG